MEGSTLPSCDKAEFRESVLTCPHKLGDRRKIMREYTINLHFDKYWPWWDLRQRIESIDDMSPINPQLPAQPLLVRLSQNCWGFTTQ